MGALQRRHPADQSEPGVVQSLREDVRRRWGHDLRLPDLRGRTPVGSSTTPVSGLTQYAQGASGGLEGVTLAPNQVPQHTHNIVADAGPGNQAPPTGAYFANAA